MNFKTNKKLFLKGLFSLTFIFKKSINLFANNELFDILNTRKEYLIRTRKIEMGDEYTEDLDLNYSNMINFKKELLNMPLDSVRI